MILILVYRAVEGGKVGPGRVEASQQAVQVRELEAGQ
jgi:hypothetical protein